MVEWLSQCGQWETLFEDLNKTGDEFLYLSTPWAWEDVAEFLEQRGEIPSDQARAIQDQIRQLFSQHVICALVRVNTRAQVTVYAQR